ncbi:MAG: phosphatidylserine decarboxylase [Desulfobacteraceae bacterium]|nr:phosphatidylserine decarboxylase [Desulfobacteraceae bacterium]
MDPLVNTPPVKAPVQLYNRQTGSLENESIMARQFMDLSYGSRLGRFLTDHILTRRCLSGLYGLWQRHPVSRSKIRGFINEFDIDMGEVQVPENGFTCFNDFFIRRLKPDARPVDREPGLLISPADGRVKIFDIGKHTRLDIKGSDMRLDEIVDAGAVTRNFEGGLGVQVRLAPVDYHRFGYIDDGNQGPIHSIDGRLFSVSPVALRVRPRIWARNYRHWCELKTRTFGPVLQAEIGAMIVGSIIQHKPAGGPCKRGEEKGYFALGGSTVLMFFKKGAVRMDPDIARYSVQGIETLVKYGEAIGIQGIA